MQAPLLALLLAVSLPVARADFTEMLAHARAAGEKAGFAALHQTRATFSAERKELQLEELWLDLKTGSFKSTVHAAPSEDADPLASGVLPASLELRSGTWETDAGTLRMDPQRKKWMPTISMEKLPAPPSNSPSGRPVLVFNTREQALARVSPDWMQALGKSLDARLKGESTAEASYPPLTLTDAPEEKTTREHRGAELTLWRGLVQRSVRKIAGVTREHFENEFAAAAPDELTPPESLQLAAREMQKRMKGFDPSKVRFLDPSKPRPFPGPPRPTFGFNIAPVSGPIEIRIASIYPGSPADRAGLQEDDVILAINGTSLTGLPDRPTLFAAFAAAGKAEKGEFTIQRGEQTLKLTIEKVHSSTFAPPEEP